MRNSRAWRALLIHVTRMSSVSPVNRVSYGDWDPGSLSRSMSAIINDATWDSRISQSSHRHNDRKDFRPNPDTCWIFDSKADSMLRHSGRRVTTRERRISTNKTRHALDSLSTQTVVLPLCVEVVSGT